MPASRGQRAPRGTALRAALGAALVSALLSLCSTFGREAFAAARGAWWTRQPVRGCVVAAAAAQAGAGPRSGTWFESDGVSSSFGAESRIDADLPGSPDLAGLWLLGGEGYDSIDRLVRAARPVGAEIGTAPAPEGDFGAGAQHYRLELPVFDLFGLGALRSSVTMWGAVRPEGGPQEGGGTYLEVGTGGPATVSLQGPFGPELPFPAFDLEVRGALAVEKRPGGSARAVGWVRMRASGQIPSIAGVAPPEELLRPAAQEICKLTIGYATKKLSQELSDDFAKWRGEQVRKQRMRSAAAA